MFSGFRSTVKQNIEHAVLHGAVHFILINCNIDRILLLSNWIGPKARALNSWRKAIDFWVIYK